MLSTVFRIYLIAVAFIFIVIVVRDVNRRKLLLQFSLSWLLLSVIMIVVAVFPVIATFVADIVRVQEPSNFVFAFGLFVLLFISFKSTARMSKITADLRAVIQHEAIDRFLMEKNKD